MTRENGYSAIGGLSSHPELTPIAVTIGYMQLDTDHLLWEMIEPLSAV
jgi:hypothetical protein